MVKIVIYTGEKPIYLCENIDSELAELIKLDSTLHLSGKDKIFDIETLLKFEVSEYKSAVISGEDFANLKNSFFRNFTLIEAAGGVVQNESGEILFIFRREKWDLPKGKIEPGESAEFCAEREIEEETGVDELILIKKITETYHIYRESQKTVLKTSHWFHFISKTEKAPVPQTEEDISTIEWISKEHLIKPLSNTFQNIKDVIEIFLQNQ